MKKTKFLIRFMWVCTLLFVVSAIYNAYFQEKFFLHLIGYLNPLGLFIALITFLIQQERQQKNKKTEFFIQLKTSFLQDEHFMDTYYHLYQYYMHRDYDLQNLSQKDIVAYLAYFDSVAIAYENGLLELDELKKSFSYYFFIAVNNPVVQDKELVKEGEYYPRLYELYHHLSQDEDILMEEYALSKSHTYKKFLQKNNFKYFKKYDIRKFFYI